MSDLLRLRLSDPASLTDAELHRAMDRVCVHREVIGPDRLPVLFRAARDRLGLDWQSLANLTGYPLSAAFSITRAAPR